MAEQKHILVVEDDTVLSGAMVSALNRDGYKGVAAADIREAMFKLKNQTYACVLLDMKLGADAGADLVDFIRERKDSMNKTTPVVVVSGNLDRPTMGKIAGQIQGALVKPFDMSSLLETVRRHAGSRPEANSK
jgi:DNA-binding response OmpR family regulator